MLVRVERDCRLVIFQQLHMNGVLQSSFCSMSPPLFTCYIEPPSRGCNLVKKDLARATAASSNEMDFTYAHDPTPAYCASFPKTERVVDYSLSRSFAKNNADLRNLTKALLTSHLLFFLLKPNLQLSEHLCEHRRRMLLTSTERCKMESKVPLSLSVSSLCTSNLMCLLAKLLAASGPS